MEAVRTWIYTRMALIYTRLGRGSIWRPARLELPICARCGRPVEGAERKYYETFERMHWTCFHYEFEHEVAGSSDPDLACGDPACPARAFDPTPQPPAW